MSLKTIKRAIELNKTFSDSYRLSGDLYGKLIPLKNPMIFGPLYGPKAKKLIEKSIELDPQNPEAYLACGRNYFSTPTAFGGNRKKAEEYFKKAIDICPSYYVSYIWLGWLYEEKGIFDLAKENYKKALELEPRSGFAEHKLKRIEKNYK